MFVPKYQGTRLELEAKRKLCYRKKQENCGWKKMIESSALSLSQKPESPSKLLFLRNFMIFLKARLFSKMNHKISLRRRYAF